MNTQQSATPFQRPDHKAKKHGRPKPKAWQRRVTRRQEVVLLGLGVEE